MSYKKRNVTITETFCDHCGKLIWSPVKSGMYSYHHTLTVKEGRKIVKKDLHEPCVKPFMHKNRMNP